MHKQQVFSYSTQFKFIIIVNIAKVNELMNFDQYTPCRVQLKMRFVPVVVLLVLSILINSTYAVVPAILLKVAKPIANTLLSKVLADIVDSMGTNAQNHTDDFVRLDQKLKGIERVSYIRQ